jgi:hypothetical protein
MYALELSVTLRPISAIMAALISVGLGPFVETLPTLCKVGAHIEILGNNLTGATSGEVEVVTPARTLKSNTRFYVRP